MITTYGDGNFKQMVPRGYQGVLPRRSRYGHDDAYELGLQPIHESSLEVLAWEDLKEAIGKARADQTMPVFHQKASWAPDGFRSNQNGLPYCWAFSATATFLDLRAMEGRDTVMLAPVSLGWLVNWKSQGYYLDETAAGIKKYGIAPADYVAGGFNSMDRNPRNYREGWEEVRSDYRLDDVLDLNTNRVDDRFIIRQAATVLCAGRPLYMAINSMSHAMMITGINWSESRYLNIEWDVRNSHGETTTLLTHGERWIPDELIGFMSSKLAD